MVEALEATSPATVETTSDERTISPSAFPPETRFYRLTVEQYQSMAHIGILSEDEHVELIKGVLTETMTKNPPHIVVVGKLMRALLSALPEGWYLNIEQPIVIGDSQPEPDFSVIRGSLDDYTTRLPNASDIMLVVEVADTTFSIDRSIKWKLYARAGIPVYWIVNLNERQIEVFSAPVDGGTDSFYGTRLVYTDATTVL